MRRYIYLFVGLMLGCSKPPQEPKLANTISLVSSFQDGQSMPDKYGAKGAGISPLLAWAGAPKGTESFALVLEDPDAPGSSPFVHWILYNIPKHVSRLIEGKTLTTAIGGKNDAGTTSYFGPKPPSGTHHYVFRLYALDTTLSLKPGASKSELIQAMKGHELGKGVLTGLYSH